jgi:hypothetical protein
LSGWLSDFWTTVIVWTFDSSSTDCDSVRMSFWTFGSCFTSVDWTRVFVDTGNNQFIAFIFAFWFWFWNADGSAWATAFVLSSFFEFHPNFTWTAWFNSRAWFWNDFKTAWATVTVGFFGEELNWLNSGAHWVVNWSFNGWAFKSGWWWGAWLAFETVVFTTFATWS